MAVSTRTRFEVFKRDCFTCQYCGRKPPEVSLHVDHIEPKAEGGTDEMFNLVTACQDCNLGKSSVPLRDRITRADLPHLTEQIEQIRKHREENEAWEAWLDGATDRVMAYWVDSWVEQPKHWPYRNSVRSWLRRFDVAEVTTAIDKAIDKCADESGSLGSVRYLAGIMRNKIGQADGTIAAPDWAATDDSCDAYQISPEDRAALAAEEAREIEMQYEINEFDPIAMELAYYDSLISAGADMA